MEDTFFNIRFDKALAQGAYTILQKQGQLACII